MRGLIGLTFVLTGAAAAFYGFYPESADRRAVFQHAVAMFSGEPETPAALAAELPLVVVDPQRRAFSPQAPLFQQVPRGGLGSAETPQPNAAAASRATRESLAGATAHMSAPMSVASNSVPAADAVTTVDTATLPNPAVAETKPAPAATPNAPLASASSDSDSGKRDLTRSLQKELKRVGCYDGEITGTWTTASRRAMKSFTDRVNATLPVEEPDYILLTMVQGHGAEACGANCPNGQVLAKDGKCLPRAIVAKAEKKTPPRPAVRKVDTPQSPSVAAAKSPEVGRAIELWAKVTPPTTGSLAAKPSVSDGWTTAVIAAPAAAALAPVTQPAPALAPLPGRMAIGGPVAVPSRPVVEASVSAVETPAPSIPKAAVARRRIPQHVVNDDRPRPRRARSYDSDGSGYAPKPVRTTSKASRVRAMHYNLFSRPDRTTN